MVLKIKYFASGLLAAIMIFCLAACEAQPASAVSSVFKTSNSLQAQFVEVTRTPEYSIVYNAANRVMYSMSNAQDNRGNFTLLVNEDGTPMIWKG